MSKTPAPKRLPAPKSISKRAAANAEHDRLLRLVWDKLDELAMAIYLGPARKTAADATARVDKYLRNLEQALQEAKWFLKEGRGSGSSDQIKQIVEKLSFLKRSGIPELTADMYLPMVESKNLAAPIYETMNSEKLVGYIDAEVNVATVSSIELERHFPYWLMVSENETPEARDRRRGYFRPDNLDLDEIQQTSWRGYRERQILWIDVRPELQPIGQVLRELKVLRSCASANGFRSRTDPYIVVVYGVEDEVAKEMLQNENFIPVSEQLLSQL